jgi:uncharacterized protein (DUF362 family)
MERREFLKRVGTTGIVAAGAALGAVLLHDPRSGAQYFRDQQTQKTKSLRSYRVNRAAGAVGMTIVRGRDPETMMRAGLGAMGDIGSFVERGDVVVIKPNVAFDRPPAMGATTNPAVVKAVARLCREAGARKIIVADNPVNQPEGCFFKSGIRQAAEEAGAEVMLPRASFFAPVRIDGAVLGIWSLFYRPFEQATKVIGVAPCKDHNLCGVSLTMKNWYGLLGGTRDQFHQKIHEVIADFAHLMKPTFVVLDATRILMHNGPTGGSLADVSEGNTLVIGVDMVAVDAFGSTLLGRDPGKLDFLKNAEVRGLGTAKWKEQNWREVMAG